MMFTIWTKDILEGLQRDMKTQPEVVERWRLFWKALYPQAGTPKSTIEKWRKEFNKEFSK